MAIIKDFLEFIKEYKIVGLAVAFIIGVAASALIKSLVDNIIMPIITVFIPGGAWKETTTKLGPFVFKFGAFAGEAVNFIIIAFVVFIIAKIALKKEKVNKI